MPYGTKGAFGGSSALAVTGFAIGGWIIGAITLILVGTVLLQLARRGRALRP